MSERQCEPWASAGAGIGFGLWILGIFLEDDPYRPDWWWWIPAVGILLFVASLLILWKAWGKS